MIFQMPYEPKSIKLIGRAHRFYFRHFLASALFCMLLAFCFNGGDRRRDGGMELGRGSRSLRFINPERVL
jgi:hypothetical protein